MALTDILRQRVEQSRQTMQVDCGSLGTLTVEALPLRECALLLVGPDASRSILYAACRELQRSGEVLRQEGKVFRPEDITQHISDEEAAQTAEAILTLSGWTASAQIAEPEAASAATALPAQDESEIPAPVDRSSFPAQGPSAATTSDAGSAITASALNPAADAQMSAVDSVLTNQQALHPEQQAILHRTSAPVQADAGRFTGAPVRSKPESAEPLPISAAAQQATLQERREYDEDVFARRLLAGLRRAAAVR